MLLRPARERAHGPFLSPACLALCVALAAMASAGCGAAARVPLETRASALGFQRSAPHVWSRWGAVGDQAFLEVVIGTDDVDAPLPLVVALHGFGDAPRVPEQPYLSMRRAFRIILPRGPIALGNGFAWSAIRVRDGRPDDLATAIGAALPRVLATLDTVRSVRPTRGSPIVVGFSQGGIVALALAAAHPQRVGLVLPMAAWLPPALEPGPTPAAPPVRAIHPRDDERIPLAPTEALVARLRAAGWHATLEVVEGTHAMSPAIEAFVARELDRALADRE